MIDNALLDRETRANLTLQIEVNDNGSPAQAATQQITINLNGVNESPPMFLSPNTASINENLTVAQVLLASDPDAPGDTITFAVTGGADSMLFDVVGNNLVFRNAPDFENPIDMGGVAGDNDYVVEVTASDNNGATTMTQMQTITVTVNPANDGPTTTANIDQTVMYTEDPGAVAIGDIVVTDQDAGDIVTALLTLSNTATGALSSNDGATYNAGNGTWTISGTTAVVNTALQNLVFNAAADNDVDATISVDIRDGLEDGATAQTGTITLDVAPQNDDPTATLNAINLPLDSSATALSDILEETGFSFSGAQTLQIADVDAGAGLVTARFQAGLGIFDVTLAAGPTISAGADSSGELTLHGTKS